MRLSNATAQCRGLSRYMCSCCIILYYSPSMSVAIGLFTSMLEGCKRAWPLSTIDCSDCSPFVGHNICLKKTLFTVHISLFRAIWDVKQWYWLNQCGRCMLENDKCMAVKLLNLYFLQAVHAWLWNWIMFKVESFLSHALCLRDHCNNHYGTYCFLTAYWWCNNWSFANPARFNRAPANNTTELHVFKNWIMLKV